MSAMVCASIDAPKGGMDVEFHDITNAVVRVTNGTCTSTYEQCCSGLGGSKFGLMKRLAPLVASLGLLAACGSGATSPTTTFAPGTLVVKAIPSLKFDASEYGPVTAGEVTIGYANSDSVRHTLILAKDKVKVANFKLVTAQRGDSDSAVVNLEKGTYVMLCDVPGHSNMKATLVVD
jgi:plastocyanin